MALVLSGGGAKGAFEVGVIAAMEEAGLVPSVLAGTSAGALNAAAIAAGLSTDDLVALWTTLESRDVMRPRHDVHRILRPWQLLRDPRELFGIGKAHTTTEHLLESIGWTWLFHTAPLREHLVELLGGERVPVAPGRTLTVACVEVGTGRLVRFTNRMPGPHRERRLYREVELTVDHVLASAAIPGLFEPVRIGDELYWDGGLVANTPLAAALSYEPEVAVVVGSGAVDRDVGEPESLGQIVSLMIDHLVRFALLKDLDHAHTVNELCRAAPDATPHSPVELIPVFPFESRHGVGQFLDFEPDRAVELIADGRQAGRRAIEAWAAGELPDIDAIRARSGA